MMGYRGVLELVFTRFSGHGMGIRNGDGIYFCSVFTHFLCWMDGVFCRFLHFIVLVCSWIFGRFLGGKEGDIDMRKKRKVDVLSAIAEREMK